MVSESFEVYPSEIYCLCWTYRITAIGTLLDHLLMTCPTSKIYICLNVRGGVGDPTYKQIYII